MASRAGVVWVDVEPDLRGVGSKIEAGTRGIRPVGLKVDLDDRQLGRATQRAQASVDGLNTRRAQQEFNTLGGTAGRALSDIQSDLRQLQSSGGLSGGQLIGVGGAAVYAGGRIIGALRPAEQAASDLNETLDFTRQVFGAGAAEIEKFGDGAARSIGASKREALDAATSFATYGKQIGLSGQELVDFSAKWTKAAADFASARNTTFEQAAGAISSAFRGENDPIEGYSILLNEATLKQAALSEGIISTTTEALTPQQRILAASSEIWRQSGDMQDNYAKTADSAANSAKTMNAEAENAKAKVGSGLTDAYAAAAGAATKLFEAVDKIPGGAEALGLGGLAVGGATVLGGSVTAILGARRAIGDYRTDLKLARAETDGIGPAGQQAFGKLGGAVKVAGGVLAGVGLVEGIAAIANELRNLDGESRDAMNFFIGNVDRGRTAIIASFDQIAAVADSSASLGDAIASIGTEFSLAGVTDVRDIEYFQQAFDQLSTTRPIAEVKAFIDAVQEQNDLLGKANIDPTAYRETKKLLDEWRGSVKLADDAQKVQTATTKLGGDALDQFGFKLDATKSKAEQYADSLGQAFDPLQGALDAQAGLEDAQRRVADAEAKVNELRSGSVEATREAADAARDLADAERSVEQAKRSQAAAYRDMADANRDLSDLEAELARVNPLTDPNRYRELSEKVNDARDAQLDAQDRVANAAESVRDAEQSVADKRSESKARTDDLADAEADLADARRGELDAAKDADVANRRLREEFEKHPEAITGTFEAIDQWVAKGMVGAETARVWKEQLLLLIAAQAQVGFQPGGAPTGAAGAPGSNVAGPPAPTTTTSTSTGRTAAAPPASEVSPQWTPLGGNRYRDEVGKVWEWTGTGWRWVRVSGGRRTGGPVQARSLYRVVEDDEPEILTLGGDTFLMMGSQSGQVTPLGGTATPAPAPAIVAPLGGTATASPAEPAGATTTAVLDRPTTAPATFDTGEIVAELRALRADVANLQHVTYAPTIHARPAEVGPTMDEAFRAARRDGWENHGKVISNG